LCYSDRIYNTLRPLFNAEIELTVQAFYNAHDLFSGEKRDDDEEEVVVTAEMIMRWKRVKDRTKQIDRVSLHKQLEEGDASQ
jgi:hypothetical protein